MFGIANYIWNADPTNLQYPLWIGDTSYDTLWTKSVETISEKAELIAFG